MVDKSLSLKKNGMAMQMYRSVFMRIQLECISISAKINF